MKPVPVLLNPSAGGAGPEAAERVAAAHRAAGVDVRTEACPPGAMEARLEELIAHGSEIVAVAGGDGTLRTAAQTLAGSRTVLAPLPLGRQNNFPNRLGIGTIERAAEALAVRSVRDVPLGTLNGRVFLDTAVVGSYARVVRLRERMRPYLATKVAAVLASFVVWIRWPVTAVTLATPDGVRSRRIPAVWIGTGRGSFPVPQEAPLAGPDGALELVLPPESGRRHAFRVLLRLLRGGWEHSEELHEVLEILHPSRIELSGPSRFAVTLDGDPFSVDGPLRVALGERVLRVVVAPSPDPGVP